MKIEAQTAKNKQLSNIADFLSSPDFEGIIRFEKEKRDKLNLRREYLTKKIRRF